MKGGSGGVVVVKAVWGRGRFGRRGMLGVAGPEERKIREWGRLGRRGPLSGRAFRERGCLGQGIPREIWGCISEKRKVLGNGDSKRKEILAKGRFLGRGLSKEVGSSG